MEPGNFRLICIHDQCPTVVKEFSNGLGEFSFSLLLCSPTDEGQFQSVFVIKPIQRHKNQIEIQTITVASNISKE